MSFDDRSKLEDCCVNLETLGRALEQYRAQNPDQFPTGGTIGPDLASLVPEHLAELPICPTSTKPHYKVLYGPWGDNVGDRDDYYQIWCNSERHASYPRYDKPNGLIRAIDDYKVPAN